MARRAATAYRAVAFPGFAQGFIENDTITVRVGVLTFEQRRRPFRPNRMRTGRSFADLEDFLY